MIIDGQCNVLLRLHQKNAARPVPEQRSSHSLQFWSHNKANDTSCNSDCHREEKGGAALLFTEKLRFKVVKVHDTSASMLTTTHKRCSCYISPSICIRCKNLLAYPPKLHKTQNCHLDFDTWIGVEGSLLVYCFWAYQHPQAVPVLLVPKSMPQTGPVLLDSVAGHSWGPVGLLGPLAVRNPPAEHPQRLGLLPSVWHPLGLGALGRGRRPLARPQACLIQRSCSLMVVLGFAQSWVQLRLTSTPLVSVQDMVKRPLKCCRNCREDLKLLVTMCIALSPSFPQKQCN